MDDSMSPRNCPDRLDTLPAPSHAANLLASSGASRGALSSGRGDLHGVIPLSAHCRSLHLAATEGRKEAVSGFWERSRKEPEISTAKREYGIRLHLIAAHSSALHREGARK